MMMMSSHLKSVIKRLSGDDTSRNDHESVNLTARETQSPQSTGMVMIFMIGVTKEEKNKRKRRVGKVEDRKQQQFQ